MRLFILVNNRSNDPETFTHSSIRDDDLPISVSEGVEGMFAVRVVRRNGGDHTSPGVSNKRVLENLGKLALTKRGMLLVLVQCSNTFLERQ